MGRNIEFSIDEYYHVFNRGNDKRDIFLTEKDYDRFLLLLYLCNNTDKLHLSNHQGSTLIELFNLKKVNTLVDIGVYCLMPNHFHLLLREKVEKGISRFMQKLLTAYMMYFNKKEERTGSLFGGGFKAVHVEHGSHLRHLYSYIHLNPCDLFCTRMQLPYIDKDLLHSFLKNYKYSSYFEYSVRDRIESTILNKDAFPGYFSSKEDFIVFIEESSRFEHAGSSEVEP